MISSPWRRSGDVRPASPRTDRQSLALEEAGQLEPAAVLERLGTADGGLDAEEASRRLVEGGPNAVRSHGARPLAVLARQLKNPLLLLLVAAAVTSIVVGEQADAGIVLGIVALSVGLGFFNEYRSERAVEALHSRITHRAVVRRGGHVVSVDVTQLVPGDVVLLDVGDIVPADLRLLEVDGLECDESVLTGEPMPVTKTAAASPPGDSSLDLVSCAAMGTVVRAGTARGAVVQTGMGTAFGHVARGLGRHSVETAFQLGLRDFSMLLVEVTAVLTISIFVANWLLGRPLLEAALFSLAIAVGLTPQLLPAIVTLSLSFGAQRLARRSVLVKRLVSIEDFGNIQVLFTDKTGTLTEGRIHFSAAVDPDGELSQRPLTLGLLCNSAVVEGDHVVGGNPLDQAIWEAPATRADWIAGYQRLAAAPFDYDRKLMSVLVRDPDGGRLIVTKGAPEALLDRCRSVPPAAAATLDVQFSAGARVVAVGTRDGAGLNAIGTEDERDLELAGFLIFVDPPKPAVAGALARLARLGVEAKILTGDNDRVASRLCADLGVPVAGTLTGAALATMSDEELGAALGRTTIFARVTPDQKSRIIKVQRSFGTDVGFLGDGVNDAVALHDADVGISVDSATDVAKDAADIVLLKKDLDILADGVVEGRRIFANTIKYVLMGTSSNFGNMFSAAGASLFLPFLPMTPTQILLNNLLYDVSEMTIPTDEVDEEMLRRPAHWDIGFIRRFMTFFGPISSAFDFLTFGVMLWVFHAHASLFQTGWFVESLATQVLVIFIIRTRRVPFFHSRPSRPLLLTSLACVMLAGLAPFLPTAVLFGFTPLPPVFFVILAVLVLIYLGLVEVGKSLFFRMEGHRRPSRPVALQLDSRIRRLRRLVTRWSRAVHAASPARTG